MGSRGLDVVTALSRYLVEGTNPSWRLVSVERTVVGLEEVTRTSGLP